MPPKHYRIWRTGLLESTGKRTADWFNGTVSVDSTVGNKTSFLIIYELSAPTAYIQTPSGFIYSQADMSKDPSAKTLTLKIPGTAETGDWKYSILSGGLQSLTITVTSQAARSDVPPIIVKAHVNQQLIDGSKPVIVFAEVSQNYRPVINAEVKATLEPEIGISEQLELLDNGAGADAFKDDGIYSRYFTKLVKGRISLKVRVKNKDGQSRFTLHRKSGALYVPGYVVNDKVELNPPKPPVPEQPLVEGNFSRTATGESFQVTISNPPIYPPNKITDLNAEIQENTVLLIWTAPGEDFDQGTVVVTGDWKYSILSGGLQSLTITVTSQAARSDVPPIIVKAHVNQQLIDGSKPVIVFAEVSQNYRPVINAEVKATLEPEIGISEQLELLDIGAAKYEIRWSDDVEMLRLNFSNSSLVNTSAVSPKEAGSVEQHSFNMTIENGTTLFFALRSEDNDDAKSEISNIAQASTSGLN
ncbi:putative epithelial chloride channel protein-like [Triplophysa rosa]|uniref:Epithelial chloride channel protein-like n=1 Tax=Triplophysa rosa TaxID=992332 RepID=A0A9W7TQ65_TRIRA|nr:putative epithelial chloride channel protein-like [Triplophysa rosa]